MLVQMRTRYAGPLGNCDPAHWIDLPNDEVEVLVEAGVAERIESAAKRVSPPEQAEHGIETAAVRTKAPRGRK